MTSQDNDYKGSMPDSFASFVAACTNTKAFVAACANTKARKLFLDGYAVAAKAALLKGLEDIPQLSENDRNVIANKALDEWTAEKTQLAAQCLTELKGVLAKYDASITWGCGHGSELQGVYDETMIVSIGGQDIFTVKGDCLSAEEIEAANF